MKFGVALAAVNRAVVFRLKRNLACGAAVGAYSVVHHAGCLDCRFFGRSAFLASYRFVLKAFFGIKFLLTGSKNKFFAAVFAN